MLPSPMKPTGSPAPRPYTVASMLIGLLLVAIAAISWGTTGATMTLAAGDAGAGPLLVGWARLAVAAPRLLATAAPFRARPLVAPPPGAGLALAAAPPPLRASPAP